MAAADLLILIDAVRRRLWRGQFVAAFRQALWGSAGLMLVAVATQLLAPVLSSGGLLLALAVLWAAMLAHAGWRRPSDAACALWGDRHLGGASAFSTWLDLRQGPPKALHAPAVRQLDSWASARVPDALQRLAAQREPPRLARPLLAALVCAALASFVLSLPDTAPGVRQEGATPAVAGSADRPALVAVAPASAELVGEVARALRPKEPGAAPQGGEGGRAPPTGSGKVNDGQSPTAPRAGAQAAAPASAMAQAGAPGLAADAVPKAGSTTAAGAGSGRDAGDSRDERADVGVSRALRGATPVQRSERGVPPLSAQRQADMDRLATYTEDHSMPVAGAKWVGPSPAAATPPAVTEATRLTPTETSYVQAWMKASERRP